MKETVEKETTMVIKDQAPGPGKKGLAPHPEIEVDTVEGDHGVLLEGDTKVPVRINTEQNPRSVRMT